MFTILTKTIVAISLLGVTLLLNSCARTETVAKGITVESGEIPPDMAKAKFVLIGKLYKKKSYDKYVEAEFAKYTGAYKLAAADYIEQQYWDVNEYRYIMDYDLEERFNSNGDRVSSCRYYIYDRKEEKYYRRKSRSSFYALEMRAYLLAIEAVRVK